MIIFSCYSVESFNHKSILIWKQDKRNSLIQLNVNEEFCEIQIIDSLNQKTL
jgi:hypothetical protein